MTFKYRHGGAVMTLGMAMVAGGCGMDEAAAPAGPGVQMEDAFSKTGSLTVNMDDDGMLSVSIQGRIGSDSESLGMAASAKQTLAETYMVLHPDAVEVPTQVLVLSEKLATQRKLALAAVRPPDSSTVGPAVSVPKDANAFYANACQSSSTGFSGYTADFCSYMEGYHALCTLYQVATNDRTYVWNDSPYTSTETLSGMSATIPIAVYHWTWTQWYGSYSGRRACLTIDGAQSNTGKIGITHQRYYTDFVGIPTSG